MACADVNMDIQAFEDAPLRAEEREEPVIQYYRAMEFVPDQKGPLHDLLHKQPAVLGSLQMMSGLLSVGVGILFAVTQEMSESLLTMCRLSQLNGAIFIFAGMISNLLFKYSGLLPVSLTVNCGCIIVAVVSACLITVDLAYWNPKDDLLLRVEVMELCVLGLEVFLSAVLCFWISKEKRTVSKNISESASN
uniref:uncharacterized protein si:ch211-269k10.4 n=1 Tax=Gasterosteus aculeatus aculeatus TaxID=481459 RepID=UPI001A99EA4D|nr:uncharacterized protein si:ch211-269k10.4 [Gasterosteus aculeatus aculeatus]